MNPDTNSDISTGMSTNMPSGMNTSNIMRNINPDNVEVMDLSTDEPVRRPMMGKLAFNPLLQKRSAAPMIENQNGSLVDPFVGGDYGKGGKVCRGPTSTLRGPREMGGTSKNSNVPELNYFDNISDGGMDTTLKSKSRSHNQTMSKDNYAGDAGPDSNVTSAGIPKKRKITTHRSSRTESPGLFMTPGPEVSMKRGTPMAPIGKPVVRIPQARTSQAPSSSFGTQARGITKAQLFKKPPIKIARPSSDAPARAGAIEGTYILEPQPQLARPTGIQHVDVASSLKYMEEQIQRTTTDIVQPVIDLTKMVKKLELENANLRDQIEANRCALSKSISEIHARQNEHEELIDGLSNDHIIHPAGTAFGGPRSTAAKEKSLFQGMLSGQGE